MSERLSSDLYALLGEAAFIKLTEEFGGTRLYIPNSLSADHEIVSVIGSAAADKLSRRYARDIIRVPLAREIRARHYRANNLSNGRIARKLGLTETGVEKLFARMDSPPAKGSNQLHLEF